MQKIDGILVDIPPAVRCFHHYTSEQRSDLQSAHTQGYKARNRIGDVFWIHPFIPDRAFDTRAQALRAALRTLAND